MKFRSFSLVLAIVIALTICSAGWTRGGAIAQKEKWEYKIMVVANAAPNFPTPEQALNRAGNEGWELVQANLNEYGYGTFILKRSK